MRGNLHKKQQIVQQLDSCWHLWHTGVLTCTQDNIRRLCTIYGTVLSHMYCSTQQEIVHVWHTLVIQYLIDMSQRVIHCYVQNIIYLQVQATGKSQTVIIRTYEVDGSTSVPSLTLYRSQDRTSFWPSSKNATMWCKRAPYNPISMATCSL